MKIEDLTYIQTLELYSRNLAHLINTPDEECAVAPHNLEAFKSTLHTLIKYANLTFEELES